jgi:MFS family permease
METPSTSGYLSLLKENLNFRRLWYGQITSELGDWFHYVALYALVIKLGGSASAMAGIMVAKLLPLVIISPLAGVVADRISRKKIMIIADILRFFVILGFLTIESSNDLWLIYALTIVELSLSSFFEPARNAIIPSLVKKQDLVVANALSGTTWSVMVSVGAASGGIFVAFLGIELAFLLNAFTFLLSAFFISMVDCREEHLRKDKNEVVKGTWSYLIDGFKYLLSEPFVLGVTFLKSGLAISGGIMTLVPLFSSQMYSTQAGMSLGIGVIYSVRGIGSALGPILFKKFFGASPRVLRNAIAFSFFMGTVAYYLLSQSNSLYFAALSVGTSTFFMAVIWVFSTSLLHIEADNRFLGRIFSIEMAGLTLVMAASNWFVGFASDTWGSSPQDIAGYFSLIFLIPGISWSLFILRPEERLKSSRSLKNQEETEIVKKSPIQTP